MKKAILLVTLLLSLIHRPACAAVPLKWTVETSRLQPVAFDAVRGETLALEATFNSYGKPLELPSSAALFYQTNGMGAAWWSVPATVTSNRISAVFAPTNDPGASVVLGFLGATGENYRAAFTLRFRHGPGATPNMIELPVKTLDFSTITVLNPPWTGGASGASTDAGVVSNIVEGYGYATTGAVAEVSSSVTSLASQVSGLTTSKVDRANTLSGYGIVDAYTKADSDDRYAPSLWTSTNDVPYILHRREPRLMAGGINLYKPAFTNYIEGESPYASTYHTWYGNFRLEASNVDGLDDLASRVSGLASSKRDLTNNVSQADGFTPWSATLPAAPNGDEWDAQPVFDTDNSQWIWNYTAWYAESGNSDPNATSVTFSFTDYGVTTTFPATRARAAHSNDTFTTHAFVTNAIAAATNAIPAVDFTTNNTALVSTITNVAGKAGGGTAQGINLHDAGLGCDWQLSVSNSVFTWTVKED